MKKELTETESKLNDLIKNGGENDIRLATGIIQHNEEFRKKLWYNIDDLIDKEDTIRYCELYCNNSNHDKIYIIIQYPGRTVVLWGRRGGKLRRAELGQYEYAVTKLNKLEKGYKIINEVSNIDKRGE